MTSSCFCATWICVLLILLIIVLLIVTKKHTNRNLEEKGCFFLVLVATYLCVSLLAKQM